MISVLGPAPWYKNLSFFKSSLAVDFTQSSKVAQGFFDQALSSSPVFFGPRSYSSISKEQDTRIGGVFVAAYGLTYSRLKR